MAVMTAQPPLPLAPEDARPVGAAAAIVEDADGGRVFVHGNLVYAWDAGDAAGRRLAAVSLMRIKAATQLQVAEAFAVGPATVRRWETRLADAGVAGLFAERKGPKRKSKLTADTVAAIRRLRAGGASYRGIAAAAGVSVGSVRNALGDTDTEEPCAPTGLDAHLRTEPQIEVEREAGTEVRAGQNCPATMSAAPVTDTCTGAAEAVVPVLADPVDRGAERALARFGLLPAAPPVFTGCARAPLAGLLLGLPALAGTGLLDTAHTVYGELPNGFYSLDTMLCESVFRALLGQARAEGAARIDPPALGRVLGLDRAPEVKTIRRKIGLLAEAGKAGDWIAAMAARHVAARPEQAAVLYVDGHVRAYAGTRKIAKTHVPRLKFPAPATVETWVSDAAGDPLLVVMAQPAASLAAELRRLIPELRATVGDHRRRAGRVRPRRLVGDAVRRPARGRVRHPDLAQGRHRRHRRTPLHRAQPHRRARPHPHLGTRRHRDHPRHRRRAPHRRGVSDAPDQPVQHRRNPPDAHPDHPRATCPPPRSATGWDHAGAKRTTTASAPRTRNGGLDVGR